VSSSTVSIAADGAGLTDLTPTAGLPRMSARRRFSPRADRRLATLSGLRMLPTTDAQIRRTGHSLYVHGMQPLAGELLRNEKR